MIDKNLLAKNLSNCLVTDGLVHSGVELRRANGLTAVEEYWVENEYHARMVQLIASLVEVVQKLEGVSQ